MSWFSVMVAAGAGAVGALPAVFVPRERKTLRIAVLLVGITVMNPLAKHFITKPHEADVAMQEVEVFRVLQQREPEAYAAIREDMVTLVRGGIDAAGLRARAQAHLGPLAKKYIPRAADETLRRFVAVVVKEIDQLRARDPVVARRFLFPAEGESVYLPDYLDAETQQEDVAALAALIESGFGAKPHEDDAQHADELIRDAVARLARTWGKDIALLSAPTAPEADPAKLTAIVADLYRELLALPVPDSGVALRRVLAGG